MKKFISLVLAMCMLCSCAFATETAEKKDEKSILDSMADWFGSTADDVGKWFGEAADEVSAWAGKAWDETSGWASDAWKDASEWLDKAWTDATAWTVGVWDSISDWTKEAWNTSSVWVSQVWDDVSELASVKWDNFIKWINDDVSAENPYAWMQAIVDMNEGAYEKFVDTKTFIASNPSVEQIQQKYNDIMTELSITDEDKKSVWMVLDAWSTSKGVETVKVATLALPFLVNMQIVSKDMTESGVEPSGSIIAQYLLTALEVVDVESEEAADAKLVMLKDALDNLKPAEK